MKKITIICMGAEFEFTRPTQALEFERNLLAAENVTEYHVRKDVLSKEEAELNG